MRLLITVAMLFVAVMAVMSVLRAALAPRTGEAAGGKAPRSERVGKLIRDPVCDTYVAAGTSLTAARDSSVFYFCSEECRTRFLAGTQPTR
jgi:YHS domain-containing protein